MCLFALAQAVPNVRGCPRAAFYASFPILQQLSGWDRDDPAVLAVRTDAVRGLSPVEGIGANANK
jgi:hypothetical protein